MLLLLLLLCVYEMFEFLPLQNLPDFNSMISVITSVNYHFLVFFHLEFKWYDFKHFYSIFQTAKVSAYKAWQKRSVERPNKYHD